MGFFAGLNDEKYDRQYTDRDLTRRIADFFKTQGKQLVAISVLVVVLAFIGAALPVAVSRMINMLNEEPTYQSIGLVGVVLMGIGVGLWGLNWLRRSLDRARGGRCRP